MQHSDCSRIIGKGGEELRNMERRTGSKIWIQNVEDMDSRTKERYVDIVGSKASNRECMDMVMELTDFCRDRDGIILKDARTTTRKRELLSSDEVMTVHVPAEEIGRVLGRGGENAKKIERESTAKLQVDKVTGKVEIYGSKTEQEKALELVLEEVFYCRTDDGQVLKDEPPKPNSDEVMVVHVPAEEIGRILGRGGENVKRIKRETSAKIQVDKVSGKVEILGLKANQEKALEMTLEDVSYCRTDDGQVLKDERSNSSPGEAMVVHVPAEDIGRILGRAGENAQRIERETSCKLKVDKWTGKVAIAGGVEDSEKALKMILEDVSWCKREDGEVLKGALEAKRGENPGESLKVWVNNRECGKVIGRGGETIQWIMNKTQCTVQIEKYEDTDKTSGERMVEIFGNPENQQEALSMVLAEVTFCRGTEGVLKGSPSSDWQRMSGAHSRDYQYAIEDRKYEVTEGAWICIHCGGGHRSKECPHLGGSRGAPPAPPPPPPPPPGQQMSMPMGMVGLPSTGGVMPPQGPGMQQMMGMSPMGVVGPMGPMMMPMFPMFHNLPLKNRSPSTSSSSKNSSDEVKKPVKAAAQRKAKKHRRKDDLEDQGEEEAKRKKGKKKRRKIDLEDL